MGFTFPGSQALLDNANHRRAARRPRRPHAAGSDGVRSLIRTFSDRRKIELCLSELDRDGSIGAFRPGRFPQRVWDVCQWDEFVMRLAVRAARRGEQRWRLEGSSSSRFASTSGKRYLASAAALHVPPPATPRPTILARGPAPRGVPVATSSDLCVPAGHPFFN